MTSAAVGPVVRPRIVTNMSAICRALSMRAVRQMICLVGGPRFSSVRADHVAWCVALDVEQGDASAQAATAAETRARTRAVDECSFARRSPAESAARDTSGVAPINKQRSKAIDPGGVAKP